MAQKRVKRRPVRFAEIGEGFLPRFFRLSFSGAQYKGPVRRLKPSSSFLQCSGYRFHVLRFLSLAAAFAYRMSAELREADLRGEKNCGAGFATGAAAAKVGEFFTNARRLKPL